MFSKHHRSPRQRRVAGSTLLAVGVLAFSAACGSAAHPAAAAGSGISPGAGQSLAGAAGSTETGAVPAPGTSSMPSMTMSMPAAGAMTAPAVPTAGNAVMIKNFAFAPAALVVRVGTTVTWTNQDTEAHTVTSTGSGGPLNSAALDTGQTFSFTFTTAGTYSYLCTIHPFMTATVTVTK